MQVSASLPNQNLHMDLWRVAKRIRKMARKLQKVVNFMLIQLTCNQLVSTCVGWPPKKQELVSNLLMNLSTTKVSASERKWVAKWNASWTQVKNLHWLASPFVQGFTDEGVPSHPPQGPNFLGFLYTLPSLQRMVLTWVQSCIPRLI